jgi:anti-sigma B factor antagonist
MAALVAGLKETRQAGGTLKICGLTEQASTVLRITMLDRIFELYPDAEQAIKAL